MAMLKNFGDMAGMRINQKKTKILTKNIREQDRRKLVEKTNFQEEKRIRYLRIQITKKMSTLFEDNYIKLIKKIQNNLERWDKLQLSLLGRIVTIKMSVLPKILFLFQTIPNRPFSKNLIR